MFVIGPGVESIANERCRKDGVRGAGGAADCLSEAICAGG